VFKLDAGIAAPLQLPMLASGELEYYATSILVIFSYFYFMNLFETFAQLYKTNNYVIPAKAGIQHYQVFPKYRPSPV
jgi:hypothetical protein